MQINYSFSFSLAQAPIPNIQNSKADILRHNVGSYICHLRFIGGFQLPSAEDVEKDGLEGRTLVRLVSWVGYPL